MTGIHPEENQLSGIGVGPQLERERAEFFTVVGFNAHHVFRTRLKALSSGNIQRTGEIIHNRINEHLNSLFLESGPAQDRDQFNLAGEPANGSLQHFGNNRLLLQHEFSNHVVLVGNSVNQIGEGGPSAFLMLGRDRLYLVIQTFRSHIPFAPDEGLLVYNVNDAGEFVFGPDGEENRERIRLELGAHVVQGIVKVRAGAIHFVDERNPRYLVFGRLSPDGFRLRLYAGDTTEHSDRTIKHTHGTLHLRREVHVTGSVNDVDAMRYVIECLVDPVFAGLDTFLRPKAGDRRRRNRDAAFAFLLHPIRNRIAIIHVANFVDQARVKENALGGGRLAGVNMRGDADVARALERVLAVRRVRRFSSC